MKAQQRKKETKGGDEKRDRERPYWVENMGKRSEAEDEECINGVKNDGDEQSRLQRLERGTNCESCDWDEIHNVSNKNLTVQSGDTKMCDLLA